MKTVNIKYQIMLISEQIINWNHKRNDARMQKLSGGKQADYDINKSKNRNFFHLFIDDWENSNPKMLS